MLAPTLLRLNPSPRTHSACDHQTRGLKEVLQKRLSEVQNSRTGIVVDSRMRVKGTNGTVFALGDAAVTNQARAVTCGRQGTPVWARVRWVTNQQRGTCGRVLRPSRQRGRTHHMHTTSQAHITHPCCLPTPCTSCTLQDKALRDADALFQAADVNADGRLSKGELLKLLTDSRKQYPQVRLCLCFSGGASVLIF